MISYLLNLIENIIGYSTYFINDEKREWKRWQNKFLSEFQPK
jgi:hypothetical protein